MLVDPATRGALLSRAVLVNMYGDGSRSRGYLLLSVICFVRDARVMTTSCGLAGLGGLYEVVVVLYLTGCSQVLTYKGSVAAVIFT